MPFSHVCQVFKLERLLSFSSDASASLRVRACARDCYHASSFATVFIHKRTIFPRGLEVLSVDLTSEKLHCSGDSVPAIVGLSDCDASEVKIVCSVGVLADDCGYARRSTALVRAILTEVAASAKHIHVRIRPHPIWLLEAMREEHHIDDDISAGDSEEDRLFEQAHNGNYDLSSDALYLARLNASYVRQLDSGEAIMSLLEIVQETLLNDDSLGLRLSGVSIAAEKLGYGSSLPDDLDSIQDIMLDSRGLELHEMGEARGLAKDLHQCVTLMNENGPQEDFGDFCIDGHLWRRWSMSFVYLIVCRPFILMGNSSEEDEEDRSDEVRRVFCNEGTHQNIVPHAAYANTSPKERPYAKKYFGILHECDEGHPRRKRRRRSMDAEDSSTDDVDIIAESGLLQLSAQVHGAQDQLVRWLGTRLAERFVSPNLGSDVPGKIRSLEVATMFYADAIIAQCRAAWSC